jgi:DNA repair protein RecN (Recombination protein N)
MLRLIRIRNFALIRELEIEFGQGLNLLTGETGSGKSILVDALGLLLGARSSQEMIRSNCDSAVIEGIFELQSCTSASEMLVDFGLEAEDNSILIRREISSAGRSRVLVNGHLATLSMLKSIGDRLANIHGQQDQRSLLDLRSHLQWLDYFGGNESMQREVQASYKKLRNCVRQLESLEVNEQERLRQVDILQFQIDEIRRLNPQPNEREELERERNVLSNSEKILALTTQIYSMLYESESSILRETNRLERILEELQGIDKSWAAHMEALRDSRYKLEDLAFAARDFAARIDFSAERLEEIHQRLYALEKLTGKYGSSISDILAFADSCALQLERILANSDSSARLSAELNEELAAYEKLANSLSEKRRQDAERLQREILREFAALAMERMRMHIKFQSPTPEEGHPRIPGFYGLNGIDHVEFLIAPNRGEEMRPLAKIASGGELSRLMLSINSLCGSEEKGKTIVYDEVDAGIGGRIADAVGRRLRDISKNNQVLCVTHLPQIAVFARQHFNVQKQFTGGRTETIVKSLDESERIDEISRMLGGATLTETTRRHALEMLASSNPVGEKD